MVNSFSTREETSYLLPFSHWDFIFNYSSEAADILNILGKYFLLNMFLYFRHIINKAEKS